jgi:hypothetical protein
MIDKGINREIHKHGDNRVEERIIIFFTATGKKIEATMYLKVSLYRRISKLAKNLQVLPLQSSEFLWRLVGHIGKNLNSQ